MAIEGPLRELGVTDVFQLLDLTRKTGRLRITSALRGNEGRVDFVRGRVVDAAIRDNPHQIGQMLLRSGRVTEEELRRAEAIQQQAGEPRRLGDILVAIGAVSRRELDRQVRHQIEAVVFELMSWSEGFFTFEDRDMADAADDGSGLSAESLLMEAARRIDEWTRIADQIPGPHVVPGLAEVDIGHAATIDLRPAEWQVLAAIDGVADISTIAITAGVSEFDAARTIYGLLSTGVVTLVSRPPLAAPVPDDLLMYVSDAREAAHDGRYADALAAAERAIAQSPVVAEAHALAGEALAGLGRVDDADVALRRALELDRGQVAWHMTAARVALRRGDLGRACQCWQDVITSAPQSPEAAQARDGLQQVARLSAVAGVSDGR